MNPRMKGCFLAFLLLFMFLHAGTSESSGIGTNPVWSLHWGGVEAKSRKLLGLDAVLDYDYAGPNIKHDPRGKKGGGSSKNP